MGTCYCLASFSQHNVLGLVCVVMSYRALIASYCWASSFKIISSDEPSSWNLEVVSYFSFPARWRQCTKALCSQLRVKGAQRHLGHSLKSLSILARASSLWSVSLPSWDSCQWGFMCRRNGRAGGWAPLTFDCLRPKRRMRPPWWFSS